MKAILSAIFCVFLISCTSNNLVHFANNYDEIARTDVFSLLERTTDKIYRKSLIFRTAAGDEPVAIEDLDIESAKNSLTERLQKNVN